MNLATFLFLGLAILSSICAATAAELAPVLDVDGDELRVGAQYKIRGAAIGAGYIEIGQGPYWPEYRCPQSVIHVPFTGEPSYGTPVIFESVNSTEKVVRVWTDLNISFYLLTDCPSNLWMVHGYDGTKEQYFITTGGKPYGHPGCGTIRNWFQIVPVEGTSNYKLIFNPHVCDPPYPRPVDVTPKYQEGQYRLHLNLGANPSENPFEIRFEKYSPAEIHQVV